MVPIPQLQQLAISKKQDEKELFLAISWIIIWPKDGIKYRSLWSRFHYSFHSSLTRAMKWNNAVFHDEGIGHFTWVELILLPSNVKGTPKDISHSLPKPSEVLPALQGQVVQKFAPMCIREWRLLQLAFKARKMCMWCLNKCHRKRAIRKQGGSLSAFLLHGTTREVVCHLWYTLPYK